VGINEILQHTNAGQRCCWYTSSAYECSQRQWRQTRSRWECRTAVGRNEVLQHVRMQVDDVDGRRAARTNLGQQWVATRFCNTYERRSTMLTVDDKHVRM